MLINEAPKELGGSYALARERYLGGVYRAYLECSMGLFIKKLITVTCRQWSELWLFTAQGKKVLGMQPFALSLLKTKSFSCLK